MRIRRKLSRKMCRSIQIHLHNIDSENRTYRTRQQTFRTRRRTQMKFLCIPPAEQRRVIRVRECVCVCVCVATADIQSSQQSSPDRRRTNVMRRCADRQTNSFLSDTSQTPDCYRTHACRAIRHVRTISIRRPSETRHAHWGAHIIRV